MSQWSNMFPIISGEPGEWSHETIFCWTGAWQNLSTWLSFHLHRLSWTQRTMTGIHTVPQSRTQVQCDSPALRTEQLRAPAAFSLSPSGFIPKKETYTFLNGSPPASTLSFFVRVCFHSFCPSWALIWFLCCDACITFSGLLLGAVPLAVHFSPKLWCCFLVNMHIPLLCPHLMMSAVDWFGVFLGGCVRLSDCESPQ